MGEYATAAPVEAFATVKGERHPTEIAALAGARLVGVAEFPRNRPADETRIKAWTSGDLHSARHIRGNPFTFRPAGKLWITSNSPPTFLNVDAGIRRRLVLLHELAHIRRYDCLTQLVAQAACALHWFNPLVWLAKSRMQSERELACDDLVLGAGTLPSTYAADLLELAYRLKQADRINQNIGMAYFKAAQLPEYPEVLRLEYVRRALPRFKSYRSWLTMDYGRSHPITQPLAETNQRIAESERLERELRALVEPSRAAR